jgi:hypothetical protein
MIAEVTTPDASSMENSGGGNVHCTPVAASGRGGQTRGDVWVVRMTTEDQARVRWPRRDLPMVTVDSMTTEGHTSLQ